MTTTEAIEQVVPWSLDRNYTAGPQISFDKESMIKRHMDTYADLSQFLLLAYVKPA